MPDATPTRWFPSLLIDARGRRTTVGTELRGALATFLTMAYILPVNASILSNAIGAQHAAAIVACTALAAGICCVLMGLIANLPVALASGMGLNALVAFSVAKAAGSWQAAMGLIVLEGLVILLLVLLGLREAVMRAIPRELRLAIGAGIGLFIALIGLSNAHLVAQGVPAPPAGPLLAPGDVRDPRVIVALFGLAVTAVLMTWRVRGALLIGIVGSTLLALSLKVTHLPAQWWSLPSLSGVAFAADVRGALRADLIPLLFAVMMVDFFDTLGTATAVAEEANLIDAQGRIPNVRRLLIVDSLAASIGGLFGVSSVTSYIESAAGVAEGARTGLHSIFVGLLFLAAIALSPITSIVPGEATAPALVLVGFLMLKQAVGINFDQPAASIPAFITLITIPTTFSIAHGIGYGILAYVVIQLFTGRVRSVHPLMWGVALAFAAYFKWSPR